MLHTMDTQKLRNKTELYLDPLNSTTRNYESIKCKDGWIYNRTMFPNTVVMEVNGYKSIFVFFLLPIDDYKLSIYLLLQWDLVCDKRFYPALALVLFGVGGLIGNYLYGFLQDYWGRRPSFFVYLFLEIVACALSSVTWNFTSWLIFRVVVGFTVPAILASPYVLGDFMYLNDKNLSFSII